MSRIQYHPLPRTVLNTTKVLGGESFLEWREERSMRWRTDLELHNQYSFASALLQSSLSVDFLYLKTHKIDFDGVLKIKFPLGLVLATDKSPVEQSHLPPPTANS